MSLIRIKSCAMYMHPLIQDLSLYIHIFVLFILLFVLTLLWLFYIHDANPLLIFAIVPCTS